MLRRLAALAAAVLLGLVVAGCGESKTPQVTVTANDFAFAGPQTFAGGVAEFTLTNDGNEEHHLQLMRLNDGATVDGVMGAVAARDLKAMFSMASFEGGVGAIARGWDWCRVSWWWRLYQPRDEYGCRWGKHHARCVRPN